MALANPFAAMRLFILMLLVLFGWPVGIWRRARARRRLRQARAELGLTVERVA